MEARLAQRLDDRERSRLEQHLEGCAACRERLEQLEGLEARLRQGWPQAELPVWLKARVLSSAGAARGAQARPRRRFLKLAGWAAAAAAALLLVARIVKLPSLVEPTQSVRLELPEGAALVREPEFRVLEARDR
jgi:anti-sigma factor RsiW